MDTKRMAITPAKPAYQAYAEKIAESRKNALTSKRGQPTTSTRAETVSPPLPTNCPDCGGQGFVGYDGVQPGHVLFGKIEPCQNETYHGADRLRRMAKISGLRPQDLNRRLDDINPAEGNEQMLSAARRMIADPRGWLYIHGGPGNAKSEVLKAIVNELNATGQGPAIYLKFSQLLNWMRDAYAEKSNRRRQLSQGVNVGDLENLSYLDRFNRVKAIKGLALDEVDKARMTEFAEEFRFDFFDERYLDAVNGEGWTLFASQTPPSEMPDPLASRFSEFEIVHNAAGDARPSLGQKRRAGRIKDGNN